MFCKAEKRQFFGSSIWQGRGLAIFYLKPMTYMLGGTFKCYAYIWLNSQSSLLVYKLDVYKLDDSRLHTDHAVSVDLEIRVAW